MEKRLEWLRYYLAWKIKLLYKFVMRKDFRTGAKYGKNRFVSAEEANLMIKDKLISGVPFACCRFGIGEFKCVVMCEKDRLWGSDSSKHLEIEVKSFELYPHDEQRGLKKFAELMRRACENADFIGVWASIVMGDHYVSTIKNIEDKIVGNVRMVEPYYFDGPWSEALAGKKVLVISPFVKEIEKQYKENRERLFEDKRVLPEFELLLQESVWYGVGVKEASPFATWFEAYDYLFEEAMKKDFDVVLLGCGAFGFPLAARFKMAGKQAIHIGGALQILFGIKGKRWEQHEISQFFNQFWIRPEKPKVKLEYKYLDDACYW